MQSMNDISDAICANLRDYRYSDGDIIRPVDMHHAIWRETIESVLLYEMCRTCMCWTGALTDFGMKPGSLDNLYMLNGE